MPNRLRIRKAHAHATIMDAELLGMAMALETGHHKIALDSQGAIARAVQLYTEPARSWIEEKIVKACKTNITLMWVRGHTGVEGNERADRADRKSTRLNSSHERRSRMPSSA